VKKCTLCKKQFEATLDWFYKEPRVKTGLSSRCKKCYAKTAPKTSVKNNHKICNSCGEEKELDCFGNDKHRKDGKLGTCKECRNGRQVELLEQKTETYNANKTKRCKTCNQYKIANLENFYKNRGGKYGVGTVCKSCKAKESPNYSQKYGDSRTCKICKQEKPRTEEFFARQHKNKPNLRYCCIDCENAKQRDRYNSDPKIKKRVKIYGKTYRQNNKVKIKKTKKLYQEKNKEKIKSHRKLWEKENRDRINLRRKKKRELSAHYKAAENSRQRTRKILNGISRSKTSLGLLGYTSSQWPDPEDFYSFLRKYFEERFLDGMSWNNYGNPNGDHSDCWHIDHIVPCNIFDLENESHQAACFHYTNLQPMWALDNISKSDTVPSDGIPELVQQLNILEN